MGEGKFIRILLFDGPYADVDDVEDFSRLRRAINKTNWDSLVTIVYTIIQDEQVVHVDMKSNVFVSSKMLSFDKYLKSELDKFYEAQTILLLELKKLEGKEKKLKEDMRLLHYDYDNDTTEIMAQISENQELFLDTLTEIGCPYEIYEYKNIIIFCYKNVFFMAHVLSDEPEIAIFCKDWESADLNDIDEVMRMKQAVNLVNNSCSISTVYNNDYDRYKLLISSSCQIYFTSHIQDRINYLRVKLNMMLSVQQDFQLEMEALRENE